MPFSFIHFHNYLDEKEEKNLLTTFSVIICILCRMDVSWETMMMKFYCMPAESFLDKLSLKVRKLKRIKLVNNTKATKKKNKFHPLYKGLTNGKNKKIKIEK